MNNQVEFRDGKLYVDGKAKYCPFGNFKHCYRDCACLNCDVNEKRIMVKTCLQSFASKILPLHGPEFRESDDMKPVVDTLKCLGGQTESQAELINALTLTAGMTCKQARNAINRAIKVGVIACKSGGECNRKKITLLV